MAVIRSMEIELSVVDMASSDITAIDQSMEGVTESAEGAQGGITGMADRLADLGGSIRNVGGAMTKYITGPLVAAGAATFGLATKTGDFADTLLDLEAATGINTDALQHFRALEVSAGTETDSLAQGIMRMNRQMQESGEYNARVVRAAEQYGVTLHETSGELRGAEGVTMDLMRSIAGIEDPQERARAGSEAFGRDWERIAPVVALGVDELDRMAEAEIISAEQLEAANEFRREWDELKREFSLVAMTIGTELAPMLQEHLMPVLRDTFIPLLERLGEGVGRLIEWFGNLDPTWQKIILGAIGLAVVLGPVLVVIGTLLTALPLIVKGLLIVKGALLIAAGPIGWIILAIGLLVAALVWLWNNCEWFRDAVTAIWTAIVAVFQWWWDGLMTMFAFIGALLRGEWAEAWSIFKEHVSNQIEMLSEFLGRAWEWIKDAAGRAGEWLVDTITERVTEAYNNVKEWIGKAVDWVMGLKDRMLTAGKDLIQGLIDGIREKTGAVVRAMRTLATDMLEGFLNIFDFGSPSRLMMEYGALLGEGLTIGVEQEERRIHEIWPKYAPGTELRPTTQGGVATGGFSPQIHINVNGAGGDAKAIATAVDRRLRVTFDDYMDRYVQKMRGVRGR